MRTLHANWKHIRRHPYQALAAVFIMMLTFLAISVFSFVVVGSSVIIRHFESKPQVTAFFKEEAKQENIDELRAGLEQTGKVATIKFVSKKDALQIYKKLNKEDPLLLEFVTDDTLPASMEISTHQLEDLAAVSGVLKNSPQVSDVVYQKDVIATLSVWTNAIRIVGIALITLLSLVSVFVMVTVIGFKVSQKKEEIEIMRLLSATGWYIRWPFIFEGILYGALGTLLGWFIASGALIYASPYLESFLKGIPLLPVSPLFLVGLLGTELLIAVILGVLASSLAVFRYLK